MKVLAVQDLLLLDVTPSPMIGILVANTFSEDDSTSPPGSESNKAKIEAKTVQEHGSYTQ